MWSPAGDEIRTRYRQHAKNYENEYHLDFVVVQQLYTLEITLDVCITIRVALFGNSTYIIHAYIDRT